MPTWSAPPLRPFVALWLSLGLASGLLAGAPRSLAPAALLDRVIVRPGSYRQSCSSWGLPANGAQPIFLYEHRLGSEFKLSDSDLRELSAARRGVAAELTRRLEKLRAVGAVPRRPGTVRDWLRPGPNPDMLSAACLEVVTSLGVVEALPALLRLEDEIEATLQRARSAPARPFPKVNWADNTSYYLRPQTYRQTAGERRAQAFSEAEAVQAELLSTVLRLLHDQRYGPLLNSRIERVFVAGRNESGASDRPGPSISLTGSLRLEVRALAESFVREAPSKRWRPLAKIAP